MQKFTHRLKQFSTDLSVNFALTVLSLCLLFLASGYPDMARTFPRLVLIMIVILTSLDSMKKILKGRENEITEPEPDKVPNRASNRSARAYITVGLMLVFLFSFLLFGFTLGTFIFLCVAFRSLGYRNMKGVVIFSVIIAGFMYAIFIVIMKSHLPQGFLIELLRG